MRVRKTFTFYVTIMLISLISLKDHIYKMCIKVINMNSLRSSLKLCRTINFFP